MNGCEKEYPIAAPKHVVFSGALERILRVTVKEEHEETSERKNPWKPTGGRIVNGEERDLGKNVECKRKPLHSGSQAQDRVEQNFRNLFQFPTGILADAAFYCLRSFRLRQFPIPQLLQMPRETRVLVSDFVIFDHP